MKAHLLTQVSTTVRCLQWGTWGTALLIRGLVRVPVLPFVSICPLCGNVIQHIRQDSLRHLYVHLYH